jgi:sulfur carrier protein ThiS
MHRGSSKAAPGDPGATETLPLSASSPPAIAVEIEVARAARSESRVVYVPPGRHIRDAIRAAGLAPEGVAVLVDDTPVPLDEPIVGPVRLTVVPTFSGG